MTMPSDLPGKVRHVFESSPQREVLLAMAEAIEALRNPPEPPRFYSSVEKALKESLSVKMGAKDSDGIDLEAD